MRGKGASPLTFCVLPGITPAYAGKRPIPFVLLLLRRDHPRVCGEKIRYAINIEINTGSPPRMRGKEIAPLSVWLYLGITPAYAGKSSHSYGIYQAGWDHPRVCGEKTKKIP